MKKSIFMLLFVSVLFISANANANAAAVSKVEKNALMRPTASNVKAYIKATNGVKNKNRIIGFYTVSANTAKIKAVKSIVTLLKKHGYYNVYTTFFKDTMSERVELTKRVGFPIVIGIPEKKFKFIYKTGFINKNVLIANEGVNLKPKAISLIHLLTKNGYNVGIATVSPKENKFWSLKSVSFPFVTIVP